MGKHSRMHCVESKACALPCRGQAEGSPCGSHALVSLCTSYESEQDASFLAQYVLDCLRFVSAFNRSVAWICVCFPCFWCCIAILFLQNTDKHVNKILIGNKCDMESSRVSFYPLSFNCIPSLEDIMCALFNAARCVICLHALSSP